MSVYSTNALQDINLFFQEPRALYLISSIIQCYFPQVIRLTCLVTDYNGFSSKKKKSKKFF